MNAGKMKLLTSAVAATFLLVGCAKKKEAKPLAPTQSLMAALKEKMKIKGGQLDGMTGSFTRVKSGDSYKISVQFIEFQALLPADSGVTGKKVTAVADVAKDNTSVAAAVSDSDTDVAGATPTVTVGCTKGCEGAIGYLVLKKGEEVVAEGGFSVDFKGANSANKADGVAKIKKAE